MRAIKIGFPAAVAVAVCVAWPIAAECQLGSGSTIGPGYLDSPNNSFITDHKFKGGRDIYLGRYRGHFSYSGVSRGCATSYARLKDLLQSTGVPKEELSGGLSGLSLRKRKDLIDAYVNLQGCDAEKTEFKSQDLEYRLGDLLDTTFVPWLMSNRDVVVDFDTDKIVRVSPDSHDSDLFAQIGPRPLSPTESSQPHEDVTTEGGFVLGTIFAEDPSAKKYEDGRPVYDLSESEGEVQFVRKFRSLMPGTLSKPVNYSLTLIATLANPSASFVTPEGTTRMIIRRGAVEFVEWDMSPNLKRHWFHDEVSNVTLSGTIVQTSDDGHAIPETRHNVELPNNHFEIRRQSWLGLSEDFFKTVPGRISVIEAAVLAWLGFFRKVRSKPDANDAAAPTEA